MIRSMTGFAIASRHGEWGELVLELRAVNHRFLDLKLTLPDALRPLEAELRARLQAGLARGRIEATVRWRPPPGSGFAINRALALRLAGEARQLLAETGTEATGGVDAVRLLAWPGVVEAAVPEPEALAPALAAASDAALAELVAMREREGAALAAALEERLVRLTTGVEACTVQSQEAKNALRVRLAERIEAFGAEVDPARVAQEAALLVVRQDTSEELERLSAHVEETRRLLAATEPVGRRLDFLMQELMREANTFASKAGDLALNRRALDFKVLIEEMREQVQNVE